MKKLKNVFSFIGLITLGCFMNNQKLFAVTSKSRLSTSDVKIHIHYPEAAKGDQLGFDVSMNTPITRLAGSSEFKEYVISANAAGDYEIDLPLSQEQKTKGVYVKAFDLNNGGEPMVEIGSKSNFHMSAEILDNYFFQNGDNVIINVKKKTSYQAGLSAMSNFVLTFKGIGHYKCQLRSSVDSMRHAQDFIYDYCNKDSSFVSNNHNVRLAYDLLSYLKPFDKAINNQAFEELRVHAFFSTTTGEALGTRLFVHERCKRSSKEFREKFAMALNTNDTVRWSQFNRQSLYYSYDFWKAEVEKYYAVSSIQNSEWLPDSLATPLSKITRPEIRERLYLLLATEFLGSYHNYTAYLQKASLYIKSIKSKMLLAELSRTTVGQIAFNFKLPDCNGNYIKLSDFKGKVVFIDFWYTGCENCRGYYEAVLSKVEEEYKSRPDIVFITISIDKNKDFWIKSIQNNHYTSTTAINLRTNGNGMDDDAIRFYDVQTFPRPLIVDKNQKIFMMDDTLRDEYVLKDALNKAAQL